MAVLLLVPAMALFGLVIAYPLVNSLWVGFQRQSLIREGSEFVGLENLQSVLGTQFWSVLWNTVVFTAGATVFPFLIGLGLALVLNREFRGRGFLRAAFLAPWLLPGVVVSFLWMWILNANYGVLNGFLISVGLIEQNVEWLGTPTSAMASIILAKTWHTFPWMAIMLLAGLQSLPGELKEAARIDGAAPWHVFRHVTLPHLRPVIVVVLILETIYNFQHFDIIYVLTGGGPGGSTKTFSLALYETAFQRYDLGLAGASGILWLLVLSIMIAVYVRIGGIEEEEV